MLYIFCSLSVCLCVHVCVCACTCMSMCACVLFIYEYTVHDRYEVEHNKPTKSHSISTGPDEPHMLRLSSRLTIFGFFSIESLDRTYGCANWSGH